MRRRKDPGTQGCYMISEAEFYWGITNQNPARITVNHQKVRDRHGTDSRRNRPCRDTQSWSSTWWYLESPREGPPSLPLGSSFKLKWGWEVTHHGRHQPLGWDPDCACNVNSCSNLQSTGFHVTMKCEPEQTFASYMALVIVLFVCLFLSHSNRKAKSKAKIPAGTIQASILKNYDTINFHYLKHSPWW